MEQAQASEIKTRPPVLGKKNPGTKPGWESPCAVITSGLLLREGYSRERVRPARILDRPSGMIGQGQSMMSNITVMRPFRCE